MINFRYHIVSLMAVFLALSVGIVLGVTFGAPVNAGITTQAEADRRQVQELRAELDRRNVLDKYRDAWATSAGQPLTNGVLGGQRVALVAMPDAPAAVVNTLTTAVTDAGGTVTSTAKVNANAFDPAKVELLTSALEPYGDALGLAPTMSDATRLGTALGRAVAAKQAGDAEPVVEQVRKSLRSASLADIDDEAGGQAQLLIVVTAEAADTPPTTEVLQARLDAEVALTTQAAGVVLAGPNSEGVEGTDVLAARNDSAAVRALSTVDVADVASGVTTVVLAGKERLLGRAGHYGALTKAESPMPALPVR
ncbi:MAG TPA: copper transporter [Propionibacteriaceae bacterium]|nr:copper transporter [Propionibacteriaceae bacterium]